LKIPVENRTQIWKIAIKNLENRTVDEIFLFVDLCFSKEIKNGKILPYHWNVENRTRKALLGVFSEFRVSVFWVGELCEIPHLLQMKNALSQFQSR
jgi:uncharacterized protein YukJ